MSMQSNRSEVDRLFFEIMQQMIPTLPLSFTETYTDHIVIDVREQDFIIKAFKDELLAKEERFVFAGSGTVKEQIKRACYDFLSAYLNKSLAWGAFTGVKPVKQAHTLLKQGLTGEAAVERIIDHFHCSRDKASLITGLASREMPLIYPLDVDRVSLYIGIPLCMAKCSYCSFISTVVDQKGENLAAYLKNLMEEIRWTGDLLNKAGKKIDTIYIGGGTPSVLSAEALEKLLVAIETAFDLSAIREYTFESGRPETTTKDKIDLLKDFDISRVCLNPQSMNEATLRLAGRFYSPRDIENCYRDLREAGFFAINMDLILGLSDESPEDFMASLNRVLDMGPENITVHYLSVKKGSKIRNTKGISIGQAYGEDFHRQVMADLERKAYLPYYLYRQKYTVGNGENIGYALAGKEGIYNILMMAEKQSIIGIGAGSSGKLYHPENDQYYRVFTAKDVKTYNENYDEILAKKNETYRLYLK